jgi:hypothetical protein
MGYKSKNKQAPPKPLEESGDAASKKRKFKDTKDSVKPKKTTTKKTKVNGKKPTKKRTYTIDAFIS